MAPEGYTQQEWNLERRLHPEIVQAHLWINQDAQKRKQRGLAAEAAFRAYALSRLDGETYVEDLKARKKYYRLVNSTWLPELARQAQRGEGDFSFLLAQALRKEARNCWNAKAVAALEKAAQAIAPSAP